MDVPISPYFTHLFSLFRTANLDLRQPPANLPSEAGQLAIPRNTTKSPGYNLYETTLWYRYMDFWFSPLPSCVVALKITCLDVHEAAILRQSPLPSDKWHPGVRKTPAAFWSPGATFVIFAYRTLNNFLTQSDIGQPEIHGGASSYLIISCDTLLTCSQDLRADYIEF